MNRRFLALSLRSWLTEVQAQASSVPDVNPTCGPTRPPAAADPGLLPGLPAQTENDIMHPFLTYGIDTNMSQYSPITTRPANDSNHFSKEA